MLTAVLIPVPVGSLANAVVTVNALEPLSGSIWEITGWQISCVGEREIEPADAGTINIAESRIARRSDGCQYPERLEIDDVVVRCMARRGHPAEIERRFLDALERVSGRRIAEAAALEPTTEGAPLIRAVVP